MYTIKIVNVKVWMKVPTGGEVSRILHKINKFTKSATLFYDFMTFW